MIKTCVSLTLSILMLLTFNVSSLEAATQKKESSKSSSSNKESKTKKGKNKKFKKAKRTKTKRVGNGPDLRALTTELPNSEYTDMPDNGVNAVETKTEL